MPATLKRMIASRVRAAFNDPAKGEEPVQRRTDGLFGPQSVAWQVHGDVTSMMVGGIAALLLQMLHPAVLAGVWDHSNFRADLHGRLRRTARFIALTTYGSRDEAEAVIAHVRGIHGRVSGTLADGTRYAAQDPELLTWVHVIETLSFLDAWRQYGEPNMSAADQDHYFAEAAVVAWMLGATSVPTTRAETLAYIEDMRCQLRADERTRTVANLILRQPDRSLEALPLEILQRAAVDLLPGWARGMHSLHASRLSRPIVASGTLAMARTLRWAFR